MKSNLMSELSFRPIHQSDMPFLSELYASTREAEMAMLVDWNDQQKNDFLNSQFQAQHKYYRETFDKAEFHIILKKNKKVGRIYIDRREDEIRLIDISIITELRGRGIGGSLLKDLLIESKTIGKPIRIHVEYYNPAMRLYTRLGFNKTGDTGVYHLMEWNAKSLETSNI